MLWFCMVSSIFFAKINLGLRPVEDLRPLFLVIIFFPFFKGKLKTAISKASPTTKKAKEQHYLWMTDFKLMIFRTEFYPLLVNKGSGWWKKKHLFNPLTLLCPIVAKWSFHQFGVLQDHRNFFKLNDSERYFSPSFFLKWRLNNYAKKLRHNDPATMTKPN